MIQQDGEASLKQCLLHGRCSLATGSWRQLWGQSVLLNLGHSLQLVKQKSNVVLRGGVVGFTWLMFEGKSTALQNWCGQVKHCTYSSVGRFWLWSFMMLHAYTEYGWVYNLSNLWRKLLILLGCFQREREREREEKSTLNYMPSRILPESSGCLHICR